MLRKRGREGERGVPRTDSGVIFRLSRSTVYANSALSKKRHGGDRPDQCQARI